MRVSWPYVCPSGALRKTAAGDRVDSGRANLGSDPVRSWSDLVTNPRGAPRAAAAAAGPAIGVLALQGDVAEHLAALGAAGSRPVPVRRPGELDGVEGLVIPGGESTTMWKLAVIFDLMEPLRKRLGSGMPAFGSCAGMIMLADRLADGIDGQET